MWNLCFFVIVNFLFVNGDKISVKIPGATTEKEDTYLCVNIPYPFDSHKTSYITKFIPHANSSVVHHLIIHGVNFIESDDREIHGCNGVFGRILYVWALNAPPFQLPDNVGVKVGAKTRIRHLILEVHYLKVIKNPDFSSVDLIITDVPQPRLAGIYLLAAGTGKVPGNSSHINLDVSCKLNSLNSLTVFGIRSHTHGLGRSVVGYYLRPKTKSLKLMGKINPKWPETFYPPNLIGSKTSNIILQDNDIIMARCIYDSKSRLRVTYIGSTHHDEMCNMYLMYFTDIYFNPNED